MFALLGMKGPFLLDDANIEEKMEADRIGNYAVGTLDGQGEFIPRKIGRSDSDLKAAIAQWIPYHLYSHFAFSYASGVKQAYEKECNNYHDLFPFLNNPPHPSKPIGENVKCPNKWCDR